MIYKLRDWIDESKLDISELCRMYHPGIVPILRRNIDKLNDDDWHYLSSNECAIELLLENYDKINPHTISNNPAAFDYNLLYNPEKEINRTCKNLETYNLLQKGLLSLLSLFDVFYKKVTITKRKKFPMAFYHLSANPHPEAIKFLKENRKCIIWSMLSRNENPEVIPLLKENPDKIWWQRKLASIPCDEVADLMINNIIFDFILLSMNPSKRAMQFLKENPNLIRWDGLSENPAPEAIELLKQNPDKINWDRLTFNQSEGAIELIKQNLKTINTHYLCSNPFAIELIEGLGKKINYKYLSLNPEIFVYDYAAMRHSRKWLHEEFAAAFYHPRRIAKMLETGIDIDDLYGI